MRRIMLTAAALALAAFGAQAAQPGKAGDDKIGQHIDITPVGVPILAEGRLVNYVFVQVRLNLVPTADPVKLREKEPFLRDALVRSAHRTSMAARTDYFHVDETLLRAAILRDVSPVIGARNIASVQILKQQSKQRTGVPRPKA